MAEEKNAMIRVKDLKKEFGDNQVLRGINYEIEKGQKIVLVGPSGCGKSTFLPPLHEPSGGSDERRSLAG